MKKLISKHQTPFSPLIMLPDQNRAVSKAYLDNLIFGNVNTDQNNIEINDATYQTNPQLELMKHDQVLHTDPTTGTYNPYYYSNDDTYFSGVMPSLVVTAPLTEQAKRNADARRGGEYVRKGTRDFVRNGVLPVAETIGKFSIASPLIFTAEAVNDYQNQINPANNLLNAALSLPLLKVGTTALKNANGKLLTRGRSRVANSTGEALGINLSKAQNRMYDDKIKHLTYQINKAQSSGNKEGQEYFKAQLESVFKELQHIQELQMPTVVPKEVVLPKKIQSQIISKKPKRESKFLSIKRHPLKQSEKFTPMDKLEQEGIKGFDYRKFNPGRPVTHTSKVTTVSYIDDKIQKFVPKSNKIFESQVLDWWTENHPLLSIGKETGLKQKANEYIQYLMSLNLPKKIIDQNLKYFNLLK